MSVQRLAAVLEDLGLQPTEEEILDVIWLAGALGPGTRLSSAGGAADDRPAAPSAEPAKPPPREKERPRRPADVPPAPPGERAQFKLAPEDVHVPAPSHGSAVRVPASAGLPSKLGLARALRPLKRTVPSGHEVVLDEDATATRIAEQGLWVPELRPARERWLELALVIDGHESMAMWKRLQDELRTLLEQLGAFADVRVWILDHPPGRPDRLSIRPRGPNTAPRSPDELLAPQGRRAILVFSDCTGPSWRSGSAHRAIARWARHGPVAILQPLPQRLWNQCAIRPVPARLRATGPGRPNATLVYEPYESVGGEHDSAPIPVPVLELDPDWLGSWSRLVTASGDGVNGIVVLVEEDGRGAGPEMRAVDGEPSSALERVQRFRAGASPDAFQLARRLAVVPISLPVARLVQEVTASRPRPAQLAEVFLGGLLRRVTTNDTADPDDVRYDFLPGVQDVLLDGLPASETLSLLERMSDELGVRFGHSRDFRAVLAGANIPGGQVIDPDSLPFAYVAEHVLRRLGGRHTAVADRLWKALASNTAAAAPAAATIVIPRYPLVCPYCFESFPDRDIMFRCSGRPPSANRNGCRPVRDEVLSQRTGYVGTLPPVFQADGRRASAVCPTCGVESHNRICPHCHSGLPAAFGMPKVGNRMIVLVGARESGKTAYMTVLIHELRHEVGKQLGSNTRGADDTTRIRFQRDYEDPLFQGLRLPEMTRPAERLGHPPMVFRFTAQRGRFRTRTDRTLLSFFDTAGEDFVSPDGFDWIARYLTGADGVLLMMDPLQLPRARLQASPEAKLPAWAPDAVGPLAVLNRVTEILRAEDSPVEKPLAAVFTKMDTLWSSLPEQSPLRGTPPRKPEFPDNDSRDVHDQIDGLLESWGDEDIRRTLGENYRRWRFFGVSALGASPTSDNRVPRRGIVPHRVADPFLWLLSVFGTIPGGDG